MKNGRPNVHIRLTDKQLWARIRAQAALESVPVGVVVERALTEFMEKKYKARKEFWLELKTPTGKQGYAER